MDAKKSLIIDGVEWLIESCDVRDFDDWVKEQDAKSTSPTNVTVYFTGEQYFEERDRSSK